MDRGNGYIQTNLNTQGSFIKIASMAEAIINFVMAILTKACGPMVSHMEEVN